MSITKSYNKQNDTYYAYETEYVYDEAKQRKVQKRRCIGKYDPVTKEIVPTAKRGRPAKKWPGSSDPSETPDQVADKEIFQGMSKLSSRLDVLESMMSSLTSELHSVRSEYDEVMRRLSKKR